MFKFVEHHSVLLSASTEFLAEFVIAHESHDFFKIHLWYGQPLR